jgi:IclR family KDG regulon transcriptional repressor
MVPVIYTDRTIKTLKEVRAVLNEIRRDGYAYSDQEREEGIRAIAAPIFSRGEARHCVTVSGPSFRLTDEKIAPMIAAVRAAALKISESLQTIEY